VALQKQRPPASTRPQARPSPPKAPPETKPHRADAKAVAKAPQIPHDHNVAEKGGKPRVTFCVHPSIDILIDPIGPFFAFVDSRLTFCVHPSIDILIELKHRLLVFP
jgi:hypothetical protein